MHCRGYKTIIHSFEFLKKVLMIKMNQNKLLRGKGTLGSFKVSKTKIFH